MSKKTESAQCARKTSIGGQALIEGIMMRGPKMTAMAVRNPEGEMVLEKWETKNTTSKWTKIPIIRGVVNFVLSMKMGYKCLMRSAEIAGLEEVEASQSETDTTAEDAESTEQNLATEAIEGENEELTKKKTETKEGSSPLMTVIMIIATVLGVGLSVLLFIMLPTFLYDWLVKLLPALDVDHAAWNSLIKSAFEGVLKIAILVAYMLLVSLMKDIRRTFQYHGAEHKTIFCYEHGKELTVENVRNERRFHPRCGTSFLILMLLVGMFISFFIDPAFILAVGHKAPTVIRAGLKVVLLPLIMGFGYELIKLAGKYDNWFTRVISAPGMWLQHVTVLEPDDGMIECAIAAFVEVIPENEKPKTEAPLSEDASEEIPKVDDTPTEEPTANEQ